MNLPTSRSGARAATLAGLALLFLTFGGIAQADTIPFSFSFEPEPLGATLTLLGVPSLGNLVVPETLMGDGVFSGLGPGTLSETGFVTFVDDGMGGFFPAFIDNNVTVTFGIGELTGHNHITFAPDANTMTTGEIALTTAATITGGTGFFAGATGMTLATGIAVPAADGGSARAQFAGEGFITTTPEPVTTWFLAIGLVGLAGAAKARKRA